MLENKQQYMWDMYGGYICFTRDHCFEIVHERFSLECRRRAFALRVASTWNPLPDNIDILEALGSFKIPKFLKFLLKVIKF